MTAAAPPFVTSLRARPGVIHVGNVDSQGITVRVEVPELWDVVRIVAPSTELVVAVKLAALGALLPKADPSRYVMKLRGFEVLDEGLSLTEAGAVDGSIFLLTHRRRRPVR